MIPKPQTVAQSVWACENQNWATEQQKKVGWSAKPQSISFYVTGMASYACVSGDHPVPGRTGGCWKNPKLYNCLLKHCCRLTSTL